MCLVHLALFVVVVMAVAIAVVFVAVFAVVAAVVAVLVCRRKSFLVVLVVVVQCLPFSFVLQLLFRRPP